MAENASATNLSALTESAVGLVTTYRRSGEGVGTPVGITVAGDHAYFTTRSRSGKVRRLSADPRVSACPSDPMGNPTGPTVSCVARQLNEEEVRAMHKGVEYHAWRFLYQVVHRDVPVSYELMPEG